MIKRALITAAVGHAILLAAAAAAAQGVAFAVVEGSYPGSELNRLDLATGDLTPVGQIGAPVTDIAFDPAERLFGVDAEHDLLLTIDPWTGAGSAVGPLGVSIAETVGLAAD